MLTKLDPKNNNKKVKTLSRLFNKDNMQKKTGVLNGLQFYQPTISVN